MNPYRKKMVDALIAHGYALQTRKAYLYAVRQLANYYHCSPDTLTNEQVQAFMVYLLDVKKLSVSTCRQMLGGIQFFFTKVLDQALDPRLTPLPKNQQKIPELLTQLEVKKLIEHASPLKYRILFELCYGCGLRLGEALNLKVRDIDSERHQIKVTQAKGNKDRMAILPPSLLHDLRHYWLQYRPQLWLVYSSNIYKPLHHTSVSKVYKRAKIAAGIDKQGGIHALRHAFATHQLTQGMPVQQLQKLLGHACLKSTMRYIHWLPNYHQEYRVSDLIAQLELPHG